MSAWYWNELQQCMHVRMYVMVRYRRYRHPYQWLLICTGQVYTSRTCPHVPQLRAPYVHTFTPPQHTHILTYYNLQSIMFNLSVIKSGITRNTNLGIRLTIVPLLVKCYLSLFRSLFAVEFHICIKRYNFTGKYMFIWNIHLHP